MCPNHQVTARYSAALRLLAAGFVLLLVPSLALAGVISGPDLFLAPTQVPTDYYTPLVLSSGDTYTFSASDVFGATQLQAIRILPLLNPDPSSNDGSYSMADLAKITVTNYTTYFNALPNTDYSATAIQGNASTVTFGTSGSYFVQLQTSNGTLGQFTLIHVEVSDSFADPDNGNKAGPARVIPAPNTDLIVISTNDPANNVAMKNAMKLYPNSPTANNLNDVKKAIQDYYNAHGKKKFSVTLIGHGFPGGIQMGTDTITNDNSGTMTAKNFQKMIDQWVNAIYFYSCSTFSGAQGDDFWKQMHDSIDIAGGWHDTITIGEKSFDADTGAKLELITPEPTELVQLTAGVLVLGLAYYRRHRKTLEM